MLRNVAVREESRTKGAKRERRKTRRRRRRRRRRREGQRVRERQEGRGRGREVWKGRRWGPAAPAGAAAERAIVAGVNPAAMGR
jgi:hypothetical protein